LRQGQGKILIEVMVFTQHVMGGEGLPCPKCILDNVCWEQGQEHQRYTHARAGKKPDFFPLENRVFGFNE